LESPEQFQGVERDPDIHRDNIEATKKMRPRPRFHLGEVHEVLERALGQGAFRPAVVNLDTLFMPEKGARLLGETLRVLNHVEGPIMVVLNVILKNRYAQFTLDDLTKAILSDPFCTHHLGDGWLDSAKGFTYFGTGRSGTRMGTTIFFRPAEEAILAG
jgi:hypothetical protein